MTPPKVDESDYVAYNRLKSFIWFYMMFSTALVMYTILLHYSNRRLVMFVQEYRNTGKKLTAKSRCLWFNYISSTKSCLIRLFALYAEFEVEFKVNPGPAWYIFPACEPTALLNIHTVNCRFDQRVIDQ